MPSLTAPPIYAPKETRCRIRHGHVPPPQTDCPPKLAGW